MNFTFFGSSRMSVIALDELIRCELVPNLIVTTPDKPQGRNLTLTPNVVKTWALNHQIPVITPVKLDEDAISEIEKTSPEVSFVASYGKIMPQSLIDLPPGKTLNIHPSLLPRYRGASPLQSAMLDDAKKTGVTIMQIDAEMDHGPIVASKEVVISEWPIYEEFEELMAREGAALLASILPKWLSGTLQSHEQDHQSATYTKKFRKEDAEINPSDDPYLNFRKIQAFHARPQAYFLITRNDSPFRVKVTSASFTAGKLNIEKVIPEGGKEMSYTDFRRGYSEAPNI